MNSRPSSSVNLTKTDSSAEQIRLRLHGPSSGTTIVYLPGLHGDWTLAASLRAALSTKMRFVEFTYPRTLEWSLQEYAAAVLNALHSAGIREGWVLAESFSSQVLWNIVSQLQSEPSSFRLQGVIMAGGFIRYPAPWLLGPVKRILGSLAPAVWRGLFRAYASYSTFRHRRAPESKEAVAEFVGRRTPRDIAALLHRLDLVAQSNPAEIAGSVTFPVYVLSGVIDPIVPWWHTFGAFRRGCPAVRARKLVWPADHNVLGTEPRISSEWILDCIAQSTPQSQFEGSKTVDTP